MLSSLCVLSPWTPGWWGAVVVAGEPSIPQTPLLSWNTRGKGHGAKLGQPQGTGGWKRNVILLPPCASNSYNDSAHVPHAQKACGHSTQFTNNNTIVTDHQWVHRGCRTMRRRPSAHPSAFTRVYTFIKLSTCL